VALQEKKRKKKKREKGRGETASSPLLAHLESVLGGKKVGRGRKKKRKESL